MRNWKVSWSDCGYSTDDAHRLTWRREKTLPVLPLPVAPALLPVAPALLPVAPALLPVVPE
jgi:hypothetical protein